MTKAISGISSLRSAATVEQPAGNQTFGSIESRGMLYSLPY
jgi:hypothetical protein